MFNTVFNPQGKVARLSYFGYSVLLSLTMFVIGMTGLFVAGGQYASMASVLLGGVVALAALVGYIYGGAILMIKRLRDMGRDPTHAVWIYAVSAGAAMGTTLDGVWLLLWVAQFGATLWLLFTPSAATGE